MQHLLLLESGAQLLLQVLKNTSINLNRQQHRLILHTVAVAASSPESRSCIGMQCGEEEGSALRRKSSCLTPTRYENLSIVFFLYYLISSFMVFFFDRKGSFFASASFILVTSNWIFFAQNKNFCCSCVGVFFLLL